VNRFYRSALVYGVDVLTKNPILLSDPREAADTKREEEKI
jgi:hypothetical protein